MWYNDLTKGGKFLRDRLLSRLKGLGFDGSMELIIWIMAITILWRAMCQ